MTRADLFSFSFQRMKALELEAKAKSPGFLGKLDPRVVAEGVLQHPRMEQRFFGCRWDPLFAEGLSLDLKTLHKVFTTLSSVQGLEQKTE